ncbi:hypothetical protein Btru_027181 [Bulinus truncatus]|nr:hypothetical protein Btru_027181 [Bulinus truncatus]
MTNFEINSLTCYLSFLRSIFCFFIDDDVSNKTLIIPSCPNSWCQMTGSDSDVLSLYPGPNLISVVVSSGSALLDKFIALPIEFKNVTQLLTIPLPKDCDFVRNTFPSDPTDWATCQKGLFTVTMYYWNSPLPCYCDVTGSVDMYCNVSGGQCHCHHGVTGRTCNKCLPDHYAFSSTGCTACNCTGSSPSCDSVTGQCQCPDNTIGRQCEFCVQNNWNWSKTEGCQDCECHPAGSVSLQCNATTGVCNCQAGFEGVKCDTCMDEYYLSNNQICSPCVCDSMGSITPVCNKTTGKCFCKENTVGQQCNACDIGSFGLGTSSSQGCLKCVCMGITLNCTSAGVRLSYDFYNLMNKSDNLTTLEVVNENATVYPVTTHADPNYIGAVILYVYTYQPQLYWKMPYNFMSNLLSLYGSELNFTLNYISISPSPMLPLNAILIDVKGEKLIYPIYNVTKGVYTNHKLPLKEDGWKKLKNEAVPTRGEFLKILSTAKALLIPASFESGNHTALLSKLLLSSVSNDGPVNPAVEQCQCGEGYLGRSCENCAPGYKRIYSKPSEFLGNCVPCECNGHSNLCDSSTGICQDCQNNTAGTSCEVCKIGYYGNPLISCTKCPCNQPRVINETCHLQNSSDGLSSIAVCNFCRPGYIGDLCDRCDIDYYGEPNKNNGSCLLCECNGNSQSCDNITGLCSFCSSNTTGSKCEHCLKGFYGNASLQNCQECNCRAANSTNCDRLTGQCACLPGVEGRDCSYCIHNYWGYNSSSGCQPCQCVDQGSVSLQCNNNTGQCLCKPNTSGNLCDVCDEGFYGLPIEPCKACDCNKTGSVAGIPCNKTTGQCNCQPGVGGQKCDQCLPMFVNFSSAGCQECGLCQKSLGEDIKSLTQEGQTLSSKTKAILDVQKEGSRLQNLSSKLNESLNLLGLAGSNATDIRGLVSEVDGVKQNLVTTFEVTKLASDGLPPEVLSLEPQGNILKLPQAVTISGLNGSIINCTGQIDAKNLAVLNLTAVLDSLSFTRVNVDNIQAQTGVYKAQAKNLNESVIEILNSSTITSSYISSNLTAAQLSARYTGAIYNGDAAIRMSGPDYLPFPSGVTNYLKAVDQLEILLSTFPDFISKVSSDIISSESHVVALNESLTAFDSSYRNISAVGRDAVKAFVNFETVIRDLNTSVDMALSAQQLIKDVENNLTGDYLAELSSTYAAEKNVSEELRNKMLATALDYQPQALKNNLDAALSKLDKERTQWMQTDSALLSMTTTADSVILQTKDKHFTDDLVSALSRVQAAASTAQSANQSASERQSELNQKQSEIGVQQSRIKQVQDLKQSLQQSLATQQNETNYFKNDLNKASDLVNSIDQRVKNVEDKIKLLETKLAKAEDLLSKLRKPLIFDGSLGLQVKNSDSGVAHLYDDVLLDVKKPGNFSDGVILYMDAPGTESEIQIGFSSGKMFFEFNTGNQTVSLNSKADICNDCWVRVYATRYANVGHLTVTPLPSGSPVSDSVIGPDSSSNTINLNSNIYIGTLPPDKSTNKVINRVFRGCLFNAQYQGQYLNLWTKAATATSQVKCCDVPPSVASPALKPGISFSGLGYIELLPGSITFSNITQLSLEIRTFSTDATLFSVKSPDQNTNFTLSLSSGYVQWTIFASGLLYTLKSNNQYSNGQWIQILAIKTSSELKLSIRYLTDQNSLDVKSLTFTSLDFSSCDGKNLLFGSDSTAGKQTAAFAGCMRNVMLTTTQAQIVSFTDFVSSSSGVSTAGCYENIIKGISFTSQSAFAQLTSPTSQMQQLKKLELDITTQEPNGILLYISSDSGLRFFYMAVFGGNVVVVYRQNNTAFLVTSGHYISDGQMHTIKVDCSTYRVSVKIDNVPFEEKTQTLTTDYLSFPSNTVLHIGGVSSVVLHSDCPVADSITGGISRLIVNDGSINLMDIVNSTDISYAGIPTTQLPTAAVNVVSCAAKPSPSYLSFTEGMAMTGLYDINFSHNVQSVNLIEYLEAEFAIDIDMAIYKADGVLLYVADYLESPDNYFTIFVMDGLVHIKLRSSTKTDLQAVLSRSLNDGHRVTISVMRINDFVAVTNNFDKDYSNTKVDSNITSQFLISNTNYIFLGGLGVYDLATSPLPEEFRLQPEKLKFAGAIYSVKVTKTPSNSVSLKIDSLDRTSFPQISTNIYYGLSLSGINSYLGLGLVSTLSSFTLNITLSTTSSSALIFLFYVETSTYFVALDFNKNKLNLYLTPSFKGITEPLLLPLDNAANLCDGFKHQLSFQIDNSFVNIAVDNVFQSKLNIPASHTIQPMSNAKLFIGGLKDSSLNLPQSLSKGSITGCVMSVTLSKEGSTIQYDPTQHAATSFGTTYGCLY